MTTRTATTAATSTPADAVSPHRPGFRRVGFGGAMLAIGSVAFLLSLALALLGMSPLNVEWWYVQVAGSPDQFVVNGVPIPVLLTVAVFAPIALLSVVGGGRLWLAWSSPRLALLASTAWLVLAVVLVVAGGSAVPIAGNALLLAILFSGAWAGRRQGSGVLDVLLRGE